MKSTEYHFYSKYKFLDTNISFRTNIRFNPKKGIKNNVYIKKTENVKISLVSTSFFFLSKKPILLLRGIKYF